MRTPRSKRGSRSSRKNWRPSTKTRRAVAGAARSSPSLQKAGPRKLPRPEDCPHAHPPGAAPGRKRRIWTGIWPVHSRPSTRSGHQPFFLNFSLLTAEKQEGICQVCRSKANKNSDSNLLTWLADMALTRWRHRNPGAAFTSRGRRTLCSHLST